MKALSEDQVRSYHRDGFLSPLPFLSRDEAAARLKDLERAEAHLGAPMTRLERKWRGASYTYLPWVNQVARDPRILDIVEDLLGPDLLVYTATFFMKEPGSDTFAAWHQDSTYFGLSPHEHVTAWIALTDANHEAGCMEVLPWNGEPARQFHHAAAKLANSINGAGQVIVEPLEERGVVAMELAAGQFSLHHTLCRHRSAPNRASHRRIGLGISYIPTSARCTSSTRVSAMLVRGEDRYGHFDDERRPQQEAGPEERAFHTEAVDRFRKMNVEQTDNRVAVVKR